MPNKQDRVSIDQPAPELAGSGVGAWSVDSPSRWTNSWTGGGDWRPFHVVTMHFSRKRPDGYYKRLFSFSAKNIKDVAAIVLPHYRPYVGPAMLVRDGANCKRFCINELRNAAS